MIPLATMPVVRRSDSVFGRRPITETPFRAGTNEPPSAQWAYSAALACAKAAGSLVPFRQSGIAVGTRYRTTLAIPDLGYVGMTVTHESTCLAIRLNCASNASYAWLAMRRHRLESNLTHVFGRGTQLEIDYDAKR